MWIVRLALRRPYTFVVAAILVAILGVFIAGFQMPTDIFPNIDIPVISICFNYAGISPEDMEKRIVTPYERILTTTVNDISHIESQSLYGVGVIKVYFQPSAQIAVANAQITAIAQTALRSLPPGTQPPLILQYSASEVPVIQLSLSSDTLPEQKMFDLAFNLLRPQLINIPGVQIPYPYGGRIRAIMVDLDPERLYSWGISPTDVSNALNNQNLILPSGTVKIGPQEYQVALNGSPDEASKINNMPIKSVTNPDGSKTTVFLKDVAHVRDGFQVQTNIVHTDGKRGVLMPILKSGNASSLAVVDAVKARIPLLMATLPPDAKGLVITPLFDQSIFVRASVQGVIREAAIAAGLTGLMILLFLGSWRSTLIVVISIPLSIMVSIIVLGLLGETLNTMTLGGMALAVGILVDDATVEIENIHRNLHMRKRLVKAILDGAQQIAVPALVSTLCICIVFVPVIFIAGVAKFLFTPLAMAVVFAMLTSYLLSRTLVPTMVHYLLAAEVEMYGGELDPEDPHAQQAIEDEEAVKHGEKPKPHPNVWKRNPWLKIVLIVGVAFLAAVAAAIGYTPLGHLIPPAQEGVAHAGAWVIANPRTMVMFAIIGLIIALTFFLIARYNLIWRGHFAFNRGFEWFQGVYGGFLVWSLVHRKTVISAFTGMVVVSIFLVFGIGEDFFPSVDAGQIRLHVRCPAGTRIEQTERYYAGVEDLIRRDIPAKDITVILDNMGIPNSSINLSLSDGSVNAPSEGEILISLKEGHEPSENYIRKIRNDVTNQMPDLVVWSAPSDIATQVLNFGLPASIDVQIAGQQNVAAANEKLAMALSAEMAKIPGVTDRRLQQVTHTPALLVDVDRTFANQVGVTQKDVANDLLISLSSTNTISPNFWLSPQNGVSYPVNVQTPQYRVDSMNKLTNTPIAPSSGTMDVNDTQLLSNLATVSRDMTPTNITHYDVKPTFDVLLGVQYLDLGTVSRHVQAVIDRFQHDGKINKATTVQIRGQVQSMNDSFIGLGSGLIFAVVLVYLLMVINFQSWLDPMIILMALPGALAGILWMLWATHTSISVPSLMGAMMSIGVATSNAILLITFANDQRKDEGRNAHDAALAAGMTRLRPVLMTAAAMIIGMLPMSLGLGEGGEQNAPLGRAVIGGLLMATFATLIFVPVVYSVLRNKPLQTHVEKELQ